MLQGDATSKNWVVWCRSKRKGNEELEERFNEDGREVFQKKFGGGRQKMNKKKRRQERAERDEAKDGGGGAMWGHIRMQGT